MAALDPVPQPEPLPIALRAYCPPPPPKKQRKRRRRKRREPLEPSPWALVFDCETTADEAHSLRFGAFQVRRGRFLRRAGFFFDARALSGSDLEVLRTYASANELELMPVGEFVEQVFFHNIHDLGGMCICFNQPFDISRLAIDHVASTVTGAFSFTLTDDAERPRVRVQHRNSTSAFIGFAPRRARRKEDPRGHFVDVRTLAKVMTGTPHSLASLTKELDTEHKKLGTDEHGLPLTAEYVHYALNDVHATWDCFAILRDRYQSYGLTGTPLTSLVSEASIGKASLRQMGIQPWRDVQPDFPPELIGVILSTYFGGRSEVRLRKQLAEVIYCDFRSMYPTSCSRMKLWEFVTADGMSWRDATERTREFLETVDLDQLQRAEMWEQMRVLVKVRPSADRFPVRAEFGSAGTRSVEEPEGTGGDYGIAQSYLTADEGIWCTLPDCVSSKLATRRVPEVLEAIDFVPGPPQQDLRPLDVAGNPAYRVDPTTDDFYARLVDLRTEVKAKAGAAEASGELERAARLEGEQLGLKITANATSYGCFIELNPRDLSRPEVGVAYGLDRAAFETPLGCHEHPGRYFHPLLATLITGAARLNLTIAERLAKEAGLDWAFCDTDSIAFVRPDEMTRDEFKQHVREIQAWFEPLNTYKTPGKLLKLEDANRRLSAGKPSNELEPLLCLAISPKRYVLFNVDGDGRPVIRKASAHGLGHLLDPYDEHEAPADIPPPAVTLHKLEITRWQYDLWYRVAEAALAGEAPDLDSLPRLDRAAMTSYTITTPRIADWFESFNEGKPYHERTRAFGFLISPIVRAFDRPLGRAGQPFHLIAPYDKTQSAWATTEYVDIYSRRHYAISTADYDKTTAKVASYRDTVERYLANADPRRLDLHGKHCTPKTAGWLSPRHIKVLHIEQIGKESKRLEELAAGLIDSPKKLHTTYTDPRRDVWNRLWLPVLHDVPRHLLRKRTRMSDSALAEVLAGRSRPHPGNARMLKRIAARLSTAQLQAWRLPVPRHQLGRLHAYLDARAEHRATPLCPVCGTLVLNPRARYCGRACKQKAYRRRGTFAETRRRANRGPGVPTCSIDQEIG
jgi:hypothetical protein